MRMRITMGPVVVVLAAGVSIEPAASAGTIDDGDLLVCGFGDPSSIGHYRTDGTLVTVFLGTGVRWEGATLTPDGEVVTTRRSTDGVNVFDQDGNETRTFDTPQVTFVCGDISAFSDGTLAVSDQGGDIDLYTPQGVYVTTFVANGLSRAFGSFVDGKDNLWVADPRGIGQDDGAVYRFARDGTLLDSFTLNWEPADLIVAPDGTLWVGERNEGRVMHITATGDPIGSFATSVSGVLDAIAMGLDGTLWVGGESDRRVLHYDQDGNPLGGFDFDANQPGDGSVFMSVAGFSGATCPEDLDGSGAVDFGDILAILTAWGNAGGPEDLDGSGIVDFGDILVVLGAWGACP